MTKASKLKTKKTKRTKLLKNEQVRWKSGRSIKGKIVKKVTKKTSIKGHHVNASRRNPQYLVKSDKTGKKAIHKPRSLKLLSKKK